MWLHIILDVCNNVWALPLLQLKCFSSLLRWQLRTVLSGLLTKSVCLCPSRLASCLRSPPHTQSDEWFCRLPQRFPIRQFCGEGVRRHSRRFRGESVRRNLASSTGRLHLHPRRHLHLHVMSTNFHPHWSNSCYFVLCFVNTASWSCA
jgi:hypothetical protein